MCALLPRSAGVGGWGGQGRKGLPGPQGGGERVAVTKGQSLCKSTYVRYTEESNSCRQQTGGGWGKGQMGSYSLTNSFCFR